MRTSVSNTTNKQLLTELLNVTRNQQQQQQQQSVTVPQPPAMPGQHRSVSLLTQIHRIVCNQSWTLRHVPEPAVQHRIVVAATTKVAKPKKQIVVQCASSTRPFPFRHVEPRVKNNVVVGVRDAWMRLSLRAIQRGETPKLKSTKTRLSTSPVVGVRDAHMRLSLRAISRSEFVLKPAKTRVTRDVVVLADPPKSVFATLLPKKPVQLNHVQTRVKTTPIVGVRDAFHRLAFRAIQRGEFSLKPTPETRITNAIVVNCDGDNKKNKKSSSNAAVLRRHAALLAQLATADDDAFEAVRIFQELDAKTRSMILELLKL
jgi:hypothetical protein